MAPAGPISYNKYSVAAGQVASAELHTHGHNPRLGTITYGLPPFLNNTFNHTTNDHL